MTLRRVDDASMSSTCDFCGETYWFGYARDCGGFLSVLTDGVLHEADMCPRCSRLLNVCGRCLMWQRGKERSMTGEPTNLGQCHDKGSWVLLHDARDGFWTIADWWCPEFVQLQPCSVEEVKERLGDRLKCKLEQVEP